VVVKKDTEMLPVTESSLNEADDLISLDELNEAVILHNLRSRFDRDVIYVLLPSSSSSPLLFLSLLIDIHRIHGGGAESLPAPRAVR